MVRSSAIYLMSTTGPSASNFASSITSIASPVSRAQYLYLEPSIYWFQPSISTIIPLSPEGGLSLPVCGTRAPKEQKPGGRHFRRIVSPSGLGCFLNIDNRWLTHTGRDRPPSGLDLRTRNEPETLADFIHLLFSVTNKNVTRGATGLPVNRSRQAGNSAAQQMAEVAVQKLPQF